MPLLAELDHGITIGNSSLKIQKPDKAHNLHPGQKGKQVLEQSDIARIRTRATSDPSIFHPSSDITEPTLKRVAGTISNGKLKVPKTDPHAYQLMLPSIEPDIGDFVPIEVLHPSGTHLMQTNVCLSFCPTFFRNSMLFTLGVMTIEYLEWVESFYSYNSEELDAY